MEKEYKYTPVSKSDELKFEKIELNSLATSITQLTKEQLGNLLAIVQFQQRINKLFFDDEKKYEKYSEESDKAIGEYLRIKEPVDSDLKKVEKVIARSLEQNCDTSGKSLVFEVAKRLCMNYQVKDVVIWTFNAHSMFENDLYDWMY